jgi:hypothetical protein
MQVMTNAYRDLVRKTEGQRYLEKPRHRWEHIIMMHLKEIEWGSVDRIHLNKDRNQQLAVELSYNPLGSIICREFLGQLRNYQLLKEHKSHENWSIGSNLK